MNTGTDSKTDGCTNRGRDTNGWTESQMDRQINGRTDTYRRTDRHKWIGIPMNVTTDVYFFYPYRSSHPSFLPKTLRQADPETN